MNEQFEPGDTVWYHSHLLGSYGVNSYPATVVGPAKPSRSGWTRCVIELHVPERRRKRIVVANINLTRRETEATS